MDRYHNNINPVDRRYSEEELKEMRERYLVKQARGDGGSSDGRRKPYYSAWTAVLSLLIRPHQN